MDYEKAASYWAQQEPQNKKAGREALLAKIEAYLAAHNTCALATGCGTQVRCTPIEYTYWQGRFWLLSEGGEKFRGLAGNANVSLAIFDPYTGFAALGGLQVTGRAQIVEPWTEDYCALLRRKKIPESALRQLDHPMYLIEITPACYDFLHSDFKKEGLSPRQRLVL